MKPLTLVPGSAVRHVCHVQQDTETGPTPVVADSIYVYRDPSCANKQGVPQTPAPAPPPPVLPPKITNIADAVRLLAHPLGMLASVHAHGMHASRSCVEGNGDICWMHAETLTRAPLPPCADRPEAARHLRLRGQPAVRHHHHFRGAHQPRRRQHRVQRRPRPGTLKPPPAMTPKWPSMCDAVACFAPQQITRRLTVPAPPCMQCPISLFPGIPLPSHPAFWGDWGLTCIRARKERACDKCLPRSVLSNHIAVQRPWA